MPGSEVTSVLCLSNFKTHDLCNFQSGFCNQDENLISHDLVYLEHLFSDHLLWHLGLLLYSECSDAHGQFLKHWVTFLEHCELLKHNNNLLFSLALLSWSFLDIPVFYSIDPCHLVALATVGCHLARLIHIALVIVSGHPAWLFWGFPDLQVSLLYFSVPKLIHFHLFYSVSLKHFMLLTSLIPTSRSFETV